MICDRQTDRLTDRQTDRQTDGRPGKNNMSPDPEGGRHNQCKIIVPLFGASYAAPNKGTTISY